MPQSKAIPKIIREALARPRKVYLCVICQQKVREFKKIRFKPLGQGFCDHCQNYRELMRVIG